MTGFCVPDVARSTSAFVVLSEDDNERRVYRQHRRNGTSQSSSSGAAPGSPLRACCACGRESEMVTTGPVD